MYGYVHTVGAKKKLILHDIFNETVHFRQLHTVWPWIPGQILHKSILCRLKKLIQIILHDILQGLFLTFKMSLSS